MMDQMNKNWNDFTKEMNEFNTKNLEVMDKFWKAAMEQNQEVVAKNIENYFTYLNGSVNYLNTMYKNFATESDEFKKLYSEKIDGMYKNFTKIYTETVTPKDQTKQA